MLRESRAQRQDCFQAATQLGTHDNDAIFVALGMLTFETGHDDVHFCLRFRDGHAGIQAAIHGESAVGSLSEDVGAVSGYFSAHHSGNENVGTIEEVGARERLRGDTDDREAVAVELDLFAGNCGIFGENAIPERIADDCYGKFIGDHIFFGEKVAPDDRLDLERRQKIAGHHCAVDIFGFAV